MADRYAAPDTVHRVHANIKMAQVRASSGQLAESIALAASALQLARQLNDQDALFRAGYELIFQQRAPQHDGERFRLVDEFVSKPRNEVSARILCQLLHFAAVLNLGRGQPTKAKGLWLQMEELAVQTHDPYVLLFPLAAEANLATLDGNLESAAGVKDRLVERGDELGVPGPARVLATSTTRSLLHLGRVEEALVLIPQALQMAGGEEGPSTSALGRARRALCLAHLGNQTDAQTTLRQVLTDFDIGPEEDETPSEFLIELLEAAVLVQDSEAAYVLARRLSGLASLGAAGRDMTCIARHLGAAAALLGDREKARAYYEQALEVCAKIRFRPEAALTHLQLAELLLQGASDPGASGKEETDALHREAIEHLDFAIAEFQAMKMQPALERALRHKGLLKA